MTRSNGTLRQAIAANKFYPPRINPSQSIRRHTIISDRLPADDFAKRILVIEAQAGQGKTTLVHQYLEYCRTPFLWYQVGSEDADPVLFLSALQLALSRNLAHFSSPQLTAILEKGHVGPLDLKGCANILLNDIDASLTEPMFFVFDDLHLLAAEAVTGQLLDYLIDTSPPHLHFILTSRLPLQLAGNAIRRNPHLVYLDSSDLALDLREVEYLYRDVLKSDITRSEAEEILAVTNGWIMGIILAAQPLSGRGKKRTGAGRQLLPSTKDGSILNYFKAEIFSHVPEALHDTVLMLAFLDEIDVALARVLTRIDAIELHLSRMADENFFVYRLDDENRSFRFHHLFQEFLQTLGRQRFGKDSVAGIYRQAAAYYLEHNLVEKALKAVRCAEDYASMEAILQQYGLELVSANRTVSILAILQTIPERTLLTHSWLAFYHGLLSIDFTPQQTLPFFLSCRSRFRRDGEQIGELMALTQIIYFHFVISGDYLTGATLLERTRELFERNRRTLPLETALIVARNLAAGYCFFESRMDMAGHYAQLGCDLATRMGSKNFIAATRFILGYIHLLSGNHRLARIEIEKAYPLASDPLVSMSNRLSLHVMQLCQLSMNGDMHAFRHHKDLVLADFDQTVVRQTIAGPYLYVWTCLGLIATGRATEALDVVEQGMLISATATSGHMTSQFLQWRAFLHAINDSEEPALADIATSGALRQAAGGPFYIALHHAAKGAALVLLGRHDDGKEALVSAVRRADSIPSPYIKSCCLGWLALIEQRNGSASFPTTLAAWLNAMRSSGCHYFWGWEPATMTTLIRSAVTLGIHTGFAKTLARQRLDLSFTETGEPIRLFCISVLGTFSIGTGRQELFGPQDFTSPQRELFGLLIASPEQRISQEQVQLAFWPESRPEKARKSFDSLVSRLRRTLAAKLNESAKEYLKVEKGYVQLNHTAIDAVDFLAAVRVGMKHARERSWWQAGNAFTGALACWSNFLPLEHFIMDQTVDFYDRVLDAFRAMCLTWSGALIELNRHDEALELLERSHPLLAGDEDIMVLRYQLYLRLHNPLKAREVIRNYRQELLRLGYDAKEAEHIISALVEPNSVH